MPDDPRQTRPAAHPRVFVLGPTSLIGRFLLPRLVKSGAKVVAVSRDPPGGSSAALTWLRRDLANPRLAEDLPGADAVISLSPIWLLGPALPALIGTGARRLVAFSSTSIVTKAASPSPQEQAVARALAEGETETARVCAGAGVAWTVMRPTMIYAERQDRNVSRLADLIERFGVVPLSGAGDGLRQPVHADDLAWAAEAVLDRPESFGRTYDLPGGETLSYREMVQRLFLSLDRPSRIMSVPPWLWRAGLSLAKPLLPGATAAMGERMSQDLVFDPTLAQRDFGWSPRSFCPRFHSVQ